MTHDSNLFPRVMKKTKKWCILAISGFLMAGLVWDGIVGYTPSKDGRWEEKIALEDMHDHCEILKMDCSHIQIVKRSPPLPGEACQFPDGKEPKCIKTKGSWHFVAQLKTGQLYSIVVLPDDFVFVGPYSQVYALE